MIPVIFCVLLGLAFGSFLNVCIARLPWGESVISPRSHCRWCGHAIAARDNIPILSWLLLKGRCRSCKAAVGWRYPAVEIATCLLFCACFASFGRGWEAAAWAAFCFLVLGLAVMDAETMRLPDWFTLPGLALGLAVAGTRGAMAMGGGSRGARLGAGLYSAAGALAAALIAAGVFLLIAGVYWLARRRQGMGMGDVKLIAMLAAWLGLPQTALVVVCATVAGAIYGLLLVGLAPRTGGKTRGAASLAIPFGAFLSLAGLYSAFLGEWTLHWYLQFFR